mgnify:FL=1
MIRADYIDLACIAVDKLLAEAGDSSVVARRDPEADDKDGFFGFTVLGVSVIMPALPVCEIKRRSPLLRLYIEGNLWGWPYAVEIMRDILAKLPREPVASTSCTAQRCEAAR